MDTGQVLNIYNAFIRRLGRLSNILYTLNLCPVSKESFQ